MCQREAQPERGAARVVRAVLAEQELQRREGLAVLDQQALGAGLRQRPAEQRQRQQRGQAAPAGAAPQPAGRHTEQRGITHAAQAGRQAAATGHQLHQVVGVGAQHHHAVPERQHPHAVQGQLPGAPVRPGAAQSQRQRPKRTQQQHEEPDSHFQAGTQAQGRVAHHVVQALGGCPQQQPKRQQQRRQRQLRAHPRGAGARRVGSLRQPGGAGRQREQAEQDGRGGQAAVAAEQFAQVVGQARQSADAQRQQQRQAQCGPGPCRGRAARRAGLGRRRAAAPQADADRAQRGEHRITEVADLSAQAQLQALDQQRQQHAGQGQQQAPRQTGGGGPQGPAPGQRQQHEGEQTAQQIRDQRQLLRDGIAGEGQPDLGVEARAQRGAAGHHLPGPGGREQQHGAGRQRHTPAGQQAGLTWSRLWARQTRRQQQAEQGGDQVGRVAGARAHQQLGQLQQRGQAEQREQPARTAARVGARRQPARQRPQPDIEQAAQGLALQLVSPALEGQQAHLAFAPFGQQVRQAAAQVQRHQRVQHQAREVEREQLAPTLALVLAALPEGGRDEAGRDHAEQRAAGLRQHIRQGRVAPAEEQLRAFEQRRQQRAQRPHQRRRPQAPAECPLQQQRQGQRQQQIGREVGPRVDVQRAGEQRQEGLQRLARVPVTPFEGQQAAVDGEGQVDQRRPTGPALAAAGVCCKHGKSIGALQCAQPKEKP